VAQISVDAPAGPDVPLLTVYGDGAVGAARRDPAIAHGLNTVRGSYSNAIVAESLGSTAVDALGADS
jgi:alanine dehydrogenase